MPTVTPGDCVRAQYDVDTPKQAAGFDDPCLRRVLALWAFSQLEQTDGVALMPVPSQRHCVAPIRNARTTGSSSTGSASRSSTVSGAVGAPVHSAIVSAGLAPSASRSAAIAALSSALACRDAPGFQSNQ